jgi:hypothetical protein
MTGSQERGGRLGVDGAVLVNRVKGGGGGYLRAAPEGVISVPQKVQLSAPSGREGDVIRGNCGTEFDLSI